MNLTLFTKKIAIAIALLAVVIFIAYTSQKFLLVFGAILIAVILIALSKKLSSKTKIKYSWSLLITGLGIIAFIALVGVFLAPSLGKQAEEFQKSFPDAVDHLKSSLKDTSWGKELSDQMPDAKDVFNDHQDEVVKRTRDIFSTLFGSLSNAFLMIMIGIFLAVEPVLYVSGFLSFFKEGEQRDKTKIIVSNCYFTLKSWLKGKFLSMLVVGVLTYIGLLFLGFPIPVVLAILAMTFAFIPNLGPLLALLPAVLIGLLDSPNSAIHVVILYVGIQILESYLITPLINKNMVSIPPGLTLFWQVLLAAVLGTTGLFLATPILAVIITLTRNIYFKDLSRY